MLFSSEDRVSEKWGIWHLQTAHLGKRISRFICVYLRTRCEYMTRYNVIRTIYTTFSHPHPLETEIC